MNMSTETNAAGSPAISQANRLLTLKEVAARLAVSPMTVHRMPLASIRLGRSLRFDPRDVEQLIEDSKEPVVLPQVAAKGEAHRKSPPTRPGNRPSSLHKSLTENNSSGSDKDGEGGGAPKV